MLCEAGILHKPYRKITMFIAHGEKVRKNARWIMAGILILLIPGFIALFTTTSGTSSRRGTDLPTVGGKPVNAAEYEQARNAFMAQYIINTGSELPRTAEFEDATKQQAVVRMLELRKARELGIRVPDSELVQGIRSQFLNDAKQFDPDRYQRFIIFLNTRGISQTLFENVMREQFTLLQLEALVTAAVKVTPQEVNLAYVPLHEKLWVDLVEFNAASNAAPVTVTDDEARAFFEKNKQAYRIPKQVKVRCAYFPVAEAKTSLTIPDSDIADFYERNKTSYADTNDVAKPLDAVKDEIRENLLQQRADRLAQDRATALTIKLVQEPGTAKPDFAKLCSEAGVTPQETEFFSLRGEVPEIQAGPLFNQAALALTPEGPFSDPVPGEDGYYVLEYLASKPSEIPPFEQAKEKVTDQLKRQKTYEATAKQGEDALAQVKKLIAEGKTFDQACAELKLKIESPGPFTVSDEKLDFPGAGRIQQTALGMLTNTVSEFISTADGGLFFYLKDRKPPEPAEFEKDKAEFAQQVLQRDRRAMLGSWVSALVRSEQVDFGRLRSREQQPEPAEPPEDEPAPPVPAPAPAKS
jgi:peptidyl-prolyl cis-trans isomerase D